MVLFLILKNMQNLNKKTFNHIKSKALNNNLNNNLKAEVLIFYKKKKILIKIEKFYFINYEFIIYNYNII